MPARERSLVEKVGIVEGGAPLAAFVSLNDCAVASVAAMMAISKVLDSRVLPGCIANCRTTRCASMSTMDGAASAIRRSACRRMDDGNGFAPAAAIDAEVGHIGGDYRVSGMEFTEPD